MNQFECAFCGVVFNSKKTKQECCSLGCRYRLNGKRQTLTLEERFWRGVQKGNNCWVWQGGKDKDGYGRFSNYVIPDAPSVIRCHRFSWELRNGPIPHGMAVLHRCDNPPCCNPDHLFLGSTADNNSDKASKTRQAFGKKIWTCKLSTEQIAEIRSKSESGVRQKDLAREYGVDRNTIYRITTRQSRTHG